MYNVEPNTQIYLCKTPLESDYKNQLTFANKESQLNYFNSKVIKSFSEYTYNRKDSTIKVNANIDEIINCNYLFYRNNGFTNKYYFCFINDMTYVNENVTLISFQTDVIQTYFFDINYKTCFIEREHVNDDTIGLHTYPENLETGEYIYQRESNFDYGNFYICVGVSEDILKSDEGTAKNSYNGVASGLTYIVVQSQTDLNHMLLLYNNGKIDAINSIFMIPEGYILPISNWLVDKSGTVHYVYVSTQKDAFDLGNMSINRPYQYIGEIDDNPYHPKNNKLFSFPYCYLEATNNTGINTIYHFEDFNIKEGSPWYSIYFSCKGSINPGCSIKFIPENYKFLKDNKTNPNYNESITGAKLPLGGWNNTVFTNWLSQNGLNIGINTIGNAFQILGGAKLATTEKGAVSGGAQVLSGIGGIASTLGSIYTHWLVPNQAQGNTNTSDINFSLNKSGLTLYIKSIKKEYAKIIDNYLSMFGYKVNTLKTPNIYGRQNWNYVKTVECNFDGDIPQTYLNIIRNAFNQGITFWHNPNTIYNYNSSNNILGGE